MDHFHYQVNEKQSIKDVYTIARVVEKLRNDSHITRRESEIINTADYLFIRDNTDNPKGWKLSTFKSILYDAPGLLNGIGELNSSFFNGPTDALAKNVQDIRMFGSYPISVEVDLR